MSKFYFFIWLRWALFVSFSSIFFASIFSAIVSLYLYVKQGLPSLNTELISALFEIFSFWFVLLWSITLLLSLFLSLKYIFNICYGEYKIELLSCLKNDKQELIEFIGYGDLVKVWRKWFMLLIWIVASEIIIALALVYLFSSSVSLFSWFNTYILYGFILLAGYFSFMILTMKCKRIRLTKC
ncbi:hypothetical protein [Sulfurimonas sp.]|jgi:hypothetical protein|uniref:hypothetical protein n=1 Tax=Sulfurimonas sp. TaxID=2022749 RepID=UPI0025E2FB22|nr:hypothetical protein [Sulfurimonas sp.]MBT5933857.1 hypothetical protein [Sulfurimonas sp.]